METIAHGWDHETLVLSSTWSQLHSVTTCEFIRLGFITVHLRRKGGLAAFNLPLLPHEPHCGHIMIAGLYLLST